MLNAVAPIHEHEIAFALQMRSVTEFAVIKQDDVYTIAVRLKGSNEVRYMATHRAPDKARAFHHSGRLMQYIEKTFPQIREIRMVIKPTADIQEHEEALA